MTVLTHRAAWRPRPGPGQHRGSIGWWTAALFDMAGSVFFMVSAFAAFVVRATDDLLDASLANTGTLLGGLCFLWAARVQITQSG